MLPVSTKLEQVQIGDQKTSEIVYIEKTENLGNTELTYEEIQDALRIVILNSKTNSNLKFSVLREMYIRGGAL